MPCLAKGACEGVEGGGGGVSGLRFISLVVRVYCV